MKAVTHRAKDAGDLVLLVPRHNQWNAAAESRPPSFPSSSVKSVKSVVFCWPSLRFPAHYSPPDQFRFLEVQEQRHLHAGDVQIIELRPSGSRGRSIATGGATIVIRRPARRGGGGVAGPGRRAADQFRVQVTHGAPDPQSGPGGCQEGRENASCLRGRPRYSIFSPC